MALSSQRICAGDETHFPWERAAVDFVLQELPDSDPHLAWPLHELLDPGSGRLYEIDLMVLARSGLFLIEIKSHPGVLTGDARDWTFTEKGGRARHLACPYPATNHKAKVLASLLGRRLGKARPYVQPLIFVAHEEKPEVRLAGGVPPYVVTRQTIRKTLVHGLPLAPRSRLVNRPLMESLRQAMRKLGLQPSRANRVVGDFRLEELVDEKEGYQEHRAVSTTVEGDLARVRSYLVPRATTVERRQQLERAARREAQVLSRLGHHPSILSYRGFHTDGALGPAVIFEAFAGGVPLSTFLKQEPELSFDDRLGILQAVVEAVDHCHRSDIHHRNLSPASVLVRRGRKGLEVRLHRFQAAAQGQHTSFGTRHVHQLAEELDRLYQAPEVLRDPTKARTTSDIFSLGCLAWLLFTGSDPAPTVQARERLIEKHKGLRLSTERGDLAVLDEALAWATLPSEIERPENALEWFEGVVLEDLTRPDPSRHESDPYEAEKGNWLGADLQVERVLGSGATAKVLKVTREGKDFALKVPHDKGCEQRLLDEAKVLKQLRHSNIVALQEVLELGDRCCLLLEFAGDQSLAHHLRSEGTLSLDHARRYGQDLLSAVHYLEEQDLTHRDIKPGNLGFTTQAKKARHLALFDFSLAAGEVTAVGVGTPAWRDPWLHVRGRWDPAADRYAAAAVLYAMLAGSRPELVEIGPGLGTVAVESERFDAAVRDRLGAFFERCFAEQVDHRFASAEQMSAEWVGLFANRGDDAPAATGDPRGRTLLASATENTLVEALPLSVRARNALDRAGVVTVAHLLQLPQNHLSAIPGVGHNVAKEIVELAAQLRQRLTVKTQHAFLADFPGPRLELDAEELDLAADLVQRLSAAGLSNTAELAQSPADQIERLLGADGSKSARVALEQLVDSQPLIGSLGLWVHELLEPRKRRQTQAELRIRCLLGLEPLPEGSETEDPPGGRSVAQVARAFGIAPALVHSSLQSLRRQWRDTECIAALEEALVQALEALDPMATFEEIAGRLIESWGVPERDADRQLCDALALVRLGAELRPAAYSWRRLHGTAWAARSPGLLDALTALAAEADLMAKESTLLSSETVVARLTSCLEAGTLAEVPADRLVALAARASLSAAASARMEIYPRGLAADRALQLSLGVLTPPGLTVEEVRQRVARRYPEAAPLPGRPALDELLAPGLIFEPQVNQYDKPGIAHLTSTGTLLAPSRLTPAQPNERRRQGPEAMEALAFQDALDRGVESGRFRVVQVRADLADRATLLFAECLRTSPLSLDHRIWSRMEEKARQLGVTEQDLLVDTDRLGPEGPEWGMLAQVAELAAKEICEEILSQRQAPRLLVHPGALARFDLVEPLQQLAHRAQHEDGAAVVLLVPSHADGVAPSVNQELPVPTESEGQRLWMPESWFTGEHLAAER